MAPETERDSKLPFGDVLIEILKGIRREIFLYAIAVIILLVGSAQLGVEILRELKWPILGFATLVLLLDIFTRALPHARKRVRDRLRKEQGGSRDS
jgi:hypothetical protein